MLFPAPGGCAGRRGGGALAVRLRGVSRAVRVCDAEAEAGPRPRGGLGPPRLDRTPPWLGRLVDFGAEPQALGIDLPRLGEHAAELEGFGVVSPQRLHNQVNEAPPIHIGLDKRGEFLELGLEDLGELAAGPEAWERARIGGEIPG